MADNMFKLKIDRAWFIHGNPGHVTDNFIGCKSLDMRLIIILITNCSKH